MIRDHIDIDGLLEEARQILLAPEAYFASLDLGGHAKEPVLKVLVYGVVAGLAAFLWSLLGLAGDGATGIFLVDQGFSALFSLPIWSLILLALLTVVVMVVSALCGGEAGFIPALQVGSSLVVLLPVNAVLGVVSGMSNVLGLLVGLGVALFGLKLFFMALTRALGARLHSAKVLVVGLAVVPLLLFLGLLVASSSGDLYEESMRNYEQFLEQLPEERRRAVQEALEETREK
jgi:hypothetical protein